MVKALYGILIAAVLAGTGWFLYHSYRSVRTETFVSSGTQNAVPVQKETSTTCSTDTDCPDGGHCIVSKGSCPGNDTSATCAVKTCSKPVACPQDARQCPDGSYVSRTGADCMFAACPSKTGEPAIPAGPTLVTPVSDLLAAAPYVNDKHQYTFAPPKGWTSDGKNNYFYDASFVDPKADTEGKLTFKSNVNIGAVPINVAGISSLDNCVTTAKLAQMFPKYVSTGDTRDTVNGTAVRIIGGTYDYGEYHLRNEQLLAVKHNLYYSVTVTALASKWDAHKDVIEATLLSLVVQ